jgi:hypothetical protein
MAQQKIDAAVLHIDGITVTDSETASLNMAINSTITTDGSTHATIAGFTASMWLEDYDPPFQFASIDFPATASDALVVVNVSQTVPVKYLTELTIFNTYLLGSPSVNVSIRGDTTVRVSGIARDYAVKFDKTVTISGFNSFDGLSVSNTTVALASTNNFNATAIIPNPSIWTIEAVSFNGSSPERIV